MSNAPPNDPPPGEPAEGQPPQGPPEGQGEPDDLERTKGALAHQRDQTEQARREAAELRRELDELRRAQMSEDERAKEEIRAEARRVALAEVGADRAEARLRALAAGKVTDVDALVAVVGPTGRFVKDDGTLDEDGLAAVVESVAKMAPAQNEGQPPYSTARRGVGEPPPPDPNAWARGILNRRGS